MRPVRDFLRRQRPVDRVSTWLNARCWQVERSRNGSIGTFNSRALSSTSYQKRPHRRSCHPHRHWNHC